ncbi:immunoglobulin-like domain-containing protein [Lysinibacillus sp. FSL R7-0073]|uniref:immunoglobulin-like domain-containing protein n=1 Tax=Lysinibacillus sp. FSL R7-0073 TaxID=2921669 RepID=UPI0030FC3F83
MIVIRYSKRKVINLMLLTILIIYMMPISPVAAKSDYYSFNAATNNEEMKLAMTTDWHVLHYSAKGNELYQNFKLADQNYLANKLLVERPQTGYQSTSTLRQVYLNAVNDRSYLINVNNATDDLTLWTIFIDDEHLNYSHFNLLTIDDQDKVCQQIIMARPNQGYDAIETLQAVLDSKVNSILKQKVHLDKDALTIVYAQDDTSENVTKNLVLPIVGENGATITWVSDKPEVVKDNGNVIRPSSDKGDQMVTLTAKISIGEYVETKVFSILVKAFSPSQNAFLKELTISSGTLNIPFNKKTLSYTAHVPSTVGSIYIRPMAEDEKARVTINGKATTEAIKLLTGVNTIKIFVTAEGGSQREYTILVTRENAPSNSKDTTASESPETPSPEIITINIESSSGETVSKTAIKRLKDLDGSMRDEVILTEKNMLEAITKLKEEGSDQARIVIPDSHDRVKQIDISMPNNIITLLKNNQLNLNISAYHVKIDVSKYSLATFNDNLYFRLIPLGEENDRLKIEERVNGEFMDQEITGSSFSKVLGGSMKIETNMQNRPVTLTLPLPKDLSEEQLKNLAIYIEHSDGSKELLRGKVIDYQNDMLGLQFEVQKFSTFSILYLPKNEDVEEPTTDITHTAYIQGYVDGTFRPNAPVTRAQMAIMFARQLTGNAIPQTKATYTDTIQHDAKDAIEFAKEKGLFEGITVTNFNPNGLITRAQMATVAARWIEKQCAVRPNVDFCQPTSPSAEFKDVSVNHWAHKAIHTVNDCSIMIGTTALTFNPEGYLTRAQSVKVLNRLFERQVTIEHQQPIFKDVPSVHWAFYEIQEAAKK